MIRTVTPYARGIQFAATQGPTSCSSCARYLLDRSPDAKEDSVDPGTNAELVVHIWEHDDDGHGGALCEACHTDSEQAPLWLMLAEWQRRGTGRRVEITALGVQLWSDGQTTWLNAPDGLLSSSDVYVVTSERPGKEGAARFDLLAGDAGKAGYELEEKLGPHRAGAMIYRASTGRVPHFYATTERALEDIKRCAAETEAPNV